MNLMAYQQGIFGKENKVLTKLFPGWKENGELVSFMYPITVGRHVLEPAGLVPLSENYQVELESYWMKPDYSVSADVRYASYVFQSCKKLKEVTLPGTSPAEGIDLSRGVFAGCSALEKVTFGYFNRTGSMYYDTFNQCSNLKDIVFTCKQPPNLTVYPGYQMVYPFRFNSYDWNDDATELAHLHITVPQGAEDDYMTAWRYPMAGYTAVGDKSAYQEMWDTIYDEITDEHFNNFDFSEVTDDEVRTELEHRLLASENRVRRLLGMEIVDEVSYTYRYIVNENGFITRLLIVSAGRYAQDATVLSSRIGVTVISAAEDVTAPVPVRTTLGGGCEAVLLPAEQKPGESYRIVC